jgi:hypothetical protein
MRLFLKGNRLFWNPAEIDFTKDAEDWASMSDDERDGAAILAASFVAGEESVTQDIQPFMRAMAAEGRLEDEMYLTQFAFEEAKHIEAFRRWLDGVGLTGDLHSMIDNEGYRKDLLRHPAELFAGARLRPLAGRPDARGGRLQPGRRGCSRDDGLLLVGTNDLIARDPPWDAAVDRPDRARRTQTHGLGNVYVSEAHRGGRVHVAGV